MATSYHPSPYGQASSPRRRALSFSLAVVAHIIVVLLLLRLAPAPPKQPEDPPLNTFTLDAEQPSARAASRATVARRAPQRRAAASTTARTPPPPVRQPVPATEKAEWPEMLSDSFDLAAVPKRGSGAAEGRGDADARGDSTAAYGPGAGPGGQRLYNADWQREPRDAELAGYIHSEVPPGSWAIIACRTAEDFQVEDCRAIDEAPPGSGFARALRQAAWQFRILPPRVGGRKLIGAWVQICWDLRRDAEGRLKCRPRRD